MTIDSNGVMSMAKYVVPMLESERGWGSKIDGYAGPFDTLVQASQFTVDYNKKNNNEAFTPDWYIVALAPVEHNTQEISYRPTV